jgi:phosphoglycerol transferase MdoB-like AlkP superfamily enzyme
MSKQISSTSSSSGIGFFGLLGIAFIVLKLTGVITWSWWWVTAPLWGGFALCAVIVVAAVVLVAVLK